MHAVKNIINNAISSKGNGKSILIVNENNADYLKGFARLHDHEFYICPNAKSPAWDKSPLPHNFKMVRSLSHINKVDLIICFGRGEGFDEAKKISIYQHVPLIVIDFCGAGTMSPYPFSASLVNKDFNHYARKNGDVNVAIHESVQNSWMPHSKGLSLTIPPMVNRIARVSQKNPKFQIAVEPFPQGYFQSLNLQVGSNAELTTDMSNADIFLNLWTHITTPVLQAMAFGTPVVTMTSQDEYVKYLSENQCCIVINEIRDIANNSFAEEILKLHEKYDMTKKALEATSENQTQFVSDWNSIIDYSTNKCYIRN